MTQNKIFIKAVIICIGFLLIATSLTTAVDDLVSEQTNKFSVEIKNISETEIKVQLDNPTFEIEEINTEHGDFTNINLPNAGYTTTIGEAQLPVLRYFIEIPYDATTSISILSESWQQINLHTLGLPHNIVPVQPSQVKLPDIQPVFIQDEHYYQQTSSTPNQLVNIDLVGSMRGRHIALLECYPVKYTPKTGELKLLTSLTFEIEFQNADLTETYQQMNRYHTKSYEQIYETIIENYGYYEQNLNPTRNDQEGLLIIVYDQFYEEILPLATWKSTQGFNTTVKKTSDIPGGTTPSNIQQYIANAYNNWAIPPTYVLLVGDTPQIGTFTGQASYTAADLYYVTVDSNDYFPEMHIGRFPASQESQVTAMVDKTLCYVQENYPDEEYIKRAVFMASTDNYWISEGTHNYVIDNYLAPRNFTCDKLYTYTYGATTQDVTNSLNDGRGLAVFSGHGSTTSWADGPYFSQSNVNALTNQDLYPYVCSHACVTGKFTESECFGETWLRAENKGGFAFWGSSANTLWDEDDILEKEMFSAWWDDYIDTIGGITDMALYELYLYYGGTGYSQYYFECYNIFGDASTTLNRGESSQNNPPNRPTQPSGPTEGHAYTEYEFSTTISDPDNDQIFLMWAWGDEVSNWTGPFNSGDTIKAYHTWNHPGEYTIKVKARDEFGMESAWSDPQQITIVATPKIEIGEISGGVGITVKILNNGTADANNVEWSIILDGGLVLLGRETTGVITKIVPTFEPTAQTGFILGFGSITVTVTAEEAEKTATAFILGPFILNVTD